MPIRVPNNLPAVETLTNENVFVMTDSRAMTQDIRPLQILILNLMPTKIDTETQLQDFWETRHFRLNLSCFKPQVINHRIRQRSICSLSIRPLSRLNRTTTTE